MGLNHRYDPVPESDENKGLIDEINHQPQHKTSLPIVTSWWKLLLCHLLAASVGAGAMFLFTREFHGTKSSTSAAASNATSNNPIPDLRLPNTSVEHSELLNAKLETSNMDPGVILDCGFSPEEARAKGCVYDVMMQDWMPEPCYDSVLTEKYLAEGNYTWYADGNGETTMSLEQMRKGEHGAAWMATAYHKDHCVFSWMKIIRALRNDRGIAQELLSYDHVMHCAHGALRADSNDQGLGVKAPTNYPKCALYDTWKLDPIPDKHNSSMKRI